MASHRRLKKPGKARTGVLTAAAATAVVLAPTFAHADPAPDRASARERVSDLYHEAEIATEEYNGLQERHTRLQREAAGAQERVVTEQAALVRLHDALGRIAGAQYRDGGLDPAVRMLLSSSPEDYLRRAALFDRLTDQQVDTLHAIRSRARVLDGERAEATGRLAELERTRRELGEKKRQIEAKLREAQRLLNLLSPAERQAVLDDDGHGGGPGDVQARPVPVSGRAGAAVAAARRALGKPYVWGATGPDSFDCSGLTGWAWRQAGVSLPRTSQAQAGAGRAVPVGQIQPGDLVVYYGGMTHVGMYVGNGQIIHAPRTGSTVRYAPLHSMPVTKVVRVS